MTPSQPPAPMPGRTWFARPLAVVTIPLGLAIAIFCVHLAPEWWRNPDLTHGFFIPVAFALLLIEARRGPFCWLATSAASTALQSLAALLAVLLFALAGLIAASLGWSHALSEFLLAGALVFGLVTGLFVLAGDGVRVIPLNWAAATACVVWIFAAPLPSGTYARLTTTLQGEITTNVLHILHLLGIPAQQRGNVLELASTTVGVAEACSGVRSLLSCIFAGVFFAGWHVRAPGRRVVLILAAPLLALLMNLLRSLTLTLMANAGWSIEGFWHDATGFAILLGTALILFYLAEMLSGPRSAIPPKPDDLRLRPRTAPFLVGGTVVVALGVVFFFYRPSAGADSTPTREAAALLPSAAPGWETESSSSLYQFSDILRTTDLAQTTYLKNQDGQLVQLTVYVAHWNAGEAPVSLVASHTPDACWPGAGWTLENGSQARQSLPVDGRTLPPSEHRIFANAARQVQQVWFWHVYDGRVINYRDPYSVPALISLALHYGFRREGPQYFVRISSNQSWDVLAAEPLVRQIFTNFARVGLKP